MPQMLSRSAPPNSLTSHCQLHRHIRLAGAAPVLLCWSHLSHSSVPVLCRLLSSLSHASTRRWVGWHDHCHGCSQACFDPLTALSHGRQHQPHHQAPLLFLQPHGRPALLTCTPRSPQSSEPILRHHTADGHHAVEAADRSGEGQRRFAERAIRRALVLLTLPRCASWPHVDDLESHKRHRRRVRQTYTVHCSTLWLRAPAV